jgi:hypothetical protein
LINRKNFAKANTLTIGPELIFDKYPDQVFLDYRPDFTNYLVDSRQPSTESTAGIKQNYRFTRSFSLQYAALFL